MTSTVTDPGEPPTKSRVGRTLAITASVLMVLLWIYVIVLAVQAHEDPKRQDSPDRIADASFGPSAQAICNRALDKVATLQPANESPTALVRADVLDKANGDLATMLQQLATLTPRHTGPNDDASVVTKWLDDWHTYLQDRRDFADALRTNPKARLLVTAKKGTQITEYLDQFAKDNDIPACSTPGDAG